MRQTPNPGQSGEGDDDDDDGRCYRSPGHHNTPLHDSQWGRTPTQQKRGGRGGGDRGPLDGNGPGRGGNDDDRGDLPHN